MLHAQTIIVTKQLTKVRFFLNLQRYINHNSYTMETLIGLSIPLLGTIIGAATVLMLRNAISDLTNRAMLGFASGVMVAASFWSLLQPAFEQSGEGFGNAWVVIAGFIAGICFLLLLDTIIPHQHVEDTNPEGPKSRLPRSIKMILAVALHNIPEGMAVGVVFAGVMNGNTTLTLSGAVHRYGNTEHSRGSHHFRSVTQRGQEPNDRLHMGRIVGTGGACSRHSYNTLLGRECIIDARAPFLCSRSNVIRCS